MCVHHVLPVVAAMKLTLFHVNLAIKYKSEPPPPPPNEGEKTLRLIKKIMTKSAVTSVICLCGCLS